MKKEDFIAGEKYSYGEYIFNFEGQCEMGLMYFTSDEPVEFTTGIRKTVLPSGKRICDCFGFNESWKKFTKYEGTHSSDTEVSE